MMVRDDLVDGVPLVRLERAPLGRYDALRRVHAAVPRHQIAHERNDDEVRSRQTPEEVHTEQDRRHGHVERRAEHAHHAERRTERRRNAKRVAKRRAEPTTERGSYAEDGRDLAALEARPSVSAVMASLSNASTGVAAPVNPASTSHEESPP